MTIAVIHAGEILADELAEVGVLVTRFARAIGVPLDQVMEIIHGRRGITDDMALRLGKCFGSSAQFWLNLQSAYERRIALDK